MGRPRIPRYTEAMSRRKHSADMESIRKHDLSIEDRAERQKALMPEANLVCLNERCHLFLMCCKKGTKIVRKRKCNAMF